MELKAKIVMEDIFEVFLNISIISAKFKVLVSVYNKTVPSNISDDPNEPVTIYLNAASRDLSL